MDALTAFKNDLTRYLRGRLATAGDVQVAGEYPPGLQKRPQRGAIVTPFIGKRYFFCVGEEALFQI